MSALAAIAATYGTLHAAHLVADHWIQTDAQALTKGAPGWPGRIACAAHVGTYLLTGLVALGLLAVASGWRPDLTALAIGMAVNGVTHYWADRRTTLAWLAALLPTTRRFWMVGAPRPDHPGDRPCLGTGAYHLDQSWHIGWLFISALIIGGAW